VCLCVCVCVCAGASTQIIILIMRSQDVDMVLYIFSYNLVWIGTVYLTKDVSCLVVSRACSSTCVFDFL
jgi:hypothetical protein